MAIPAGLDRNKSESMVNTSPSLSEHPNSSRLRLTDWRAPAEHLDGAWWPTSNRLEDQLPDLAAAIRDRIPSLALVGYHRDGWIAPPHMDLGDGHTVQLLGFESDEPPTLVLIGEDGHHLTLRVIDPDTGEREARDALDDIPRRPRTQQQVRPASRSLIEVAKKLAEHEGRNEAQRDAEILRWCEDAAAQFDDARIQTFVPILVEHIVNNRISRERHAARGRKDSPDAGQTVRS